MHKNDLDDTNYGMHRNTCGSIVMWAFFKNFMIPIKIPT